MFACDMYQVYEINDDWLNAILVEFNEFSTSLQFDAERL